MPISVASKLASKSEPRHRAQPRVRTFLRYAAMTANSSGAQLGRRRHDGDVLEGELAVRLVGLAERVMAAEAGVAVVFGAAADRLVDALHREVGEAVGVELVGDLVDRPTVGDHLLAG